VIAALSQINDHAAVRSVLHEWRQFIRPETTANDPERRYRLYHSTFAEFLRDKETVNEWANTVKKSAQLRADAVERLFLHRPQTNRPSNTDS
jgi:hypothetical protein